MSINNSKRNSRQKKCCVEWAWKRIWGWLWLLANRTVLHSFSARNGISLLLILLDHCSDLHLLRLRHRCKQDPESEIVAEAWLVSQLLTCLWLVSGGWGCLWSVAGQLEQKKGNLFLLHPNKSFEGRQFPDTANITSLQHDCWNPFPINWNILLPFRKIISNLTPLSLSRGWIWGWLQS